MASTGGGQAQCAQGHVIAVSNFPVFLTVAKDDTYGVNVCATFNGVPKRQPLVPKSEAQWLCVVIQAQVHLVKRPLRHIVECKNQIAVMLVVQVIDQWHAEPAVYGSLHIHRIDEYGIQTFIRVVQVIK